MALLSYHYPHPRCSMLPEDRRPTGHSLTLFTLLAVALLLALALSLLRSRTTPAQAAGATCPGSAQEWTVDGGLPLSAYAALIPRKLPPADPRQKAKPCNPDYEVEMEGLCWVELVAKQCPPDATVHNGRCYWRVLKAEKLPRPPTSGPGQLPPGFAAPR